MARRARWAGQFYPGDAAALGAEVDKLLAAWPAREEHPWALIVPHAGYIYSGQSAAAAYALLGSACKRVILFGPAHHEPVAGFGLSLEESWETPLGSLPVDRDAVQRLLAGGAPFIRAESAMGAEHSLEVQVPFIQRRLGELPFLPVIVGKADSRERSIARERLRELSAPGDLWLVSTDLSHFYSQSEAEILDAEAERLIAAGRAPAFEKALGEGRVEACGAVPLLLFLEECEARGGLVEILDRSDSARASGDRQSVVGYLAAAGWE